MLQDEEDLKKIETKIVQEGTMSLEDYRLQLSKSTKVAKYTKMLKHVPGTSQYLEQLKSLEASMGSIQHELAILDSMLPEERRNHQLFFDRGFKRKQRVADSSGRSVEEVNRVLDRFRLTREAFAFIAKLKRDGQKVPDSQEDVMRLLLQNPEFIARFRKLKINPSVLSEASGAQSPSQSMPRRH
jgi:signal recognition particle GTPase